MGRADTLPGAFTPSPMTLDIGILLALACAFVANLGFFFKYRGANEAEQLANRILHASPPT